LRKSVFCSQRPKLYPKRRPPSLSHLFYSSVVFESISPSALVLYSLPNFNTLLFNGQKNPGLAKNASDCFTNGRLFRRLCTPPPPPPRSASRAFRGLDHLLMVFLCLLFLSSAKIRELDVHPQPFLFSPCEGERVYSSY